MSYKRLALCALLSSVILPATTLADELKYRLECGLTRTNAETGEEGLIQSVNGTVTVQETTAGPFLIIGPIVELNADVNQFLRIELNFNHPDNGAFAQLSFHAAVPDETSPETKKAAEQFQASATTRLHLDGKDLFSLSLPLAVGSQKLNCSLIPIEVD